MISSNDAHTCYNRIAHAILSISLQQRGVGQEPLESTLYVIQFMTHYIRLAFGDSAESYQGTVDRPYQGIYQGHGSAPSCWFSLSTPIINMMRESGFGFEHWSAISSKALFLAYFAYVDDTDLVHSPSITATGEDIMELAQVVLDTCECGIKATGGALSPLKSYWHLIDFKCSQQGIWSYRKIAEMPGDLTLPALHGNERVILTRLEAHETRKALGLKLCRDGKDSANVAFFRSKTVAWADLIRTSKLRKADAWHGLLSTIMKSIEYPLMATCFSETQCRNIMAPAVMAGLNKSSIQKFFPRELVCGPTSMQGLGVKFIHTTQLAEHLSMMMRHGHRDSFTG